jgi:hypothetical protein
MSILKSVQLIKTKSFLVIKIAYKKGAKKSLIILSFF